MREKLIELLGADTCPETDCCDGCVYHENEEACFQYLKATMADHLIANGVTIPVRCKDCKHCLRHTVPLGAYGYCNHFGYYDYAPEVQPDDFCSYGERGEGDA